VACARLSDPAAPQFVSAGAEAAPLVTDIWRIGIARARLAEIIEANSLEGIATIWLPEGGALTFLADPFGLWRNDQLFLFAEVFDYRRRIGRIDVFTFDASFNEMARACALREPWHLSYPVVIEGEGETFLLPEAHRSGGLMLYRAVEFPNRWEPVTGISLDCVPVDATPLFFDGLWWLFYSPTGSAVDKVSRLHVAFAERLTGPWRSHPRNPVRIDRSSARPGGTPIVVDGCIVLPMQDCTHTYGGGIRPLRITRLTPTAFDAEAGGLIASPPGFAPFDDGLHTLSACGDVTLIDAKRIDRSLRGLLVGAGYQARRLFSAPSSQVG
jgi:hypothetical protein